MSNQEETEQEQQRKEKIEELKQKLEECEQEKEEFLAGWKRSRADLVNYKKGEQERLKKAGQKARREMILKFLPVLDSFDRAEENSDELSEGLQQIRKELQSILSQEEVERIDTDCKFDPALHEAVEQVSTEKEEGMIVEEIKAGYKHQGQVIRAAKVKVAAENDN